MNGGLEKKFFENIASKTSEISTSKTSSKPVQNQFYFLKFENFSEALEAILSKNLFSRSPFILAK